MGRQALLGRLARRSDSVVPGSRYCNSNDADWCGVRVRRRRGIQRKADKGWSDRQGYDETHENCPRNASRASRRNARVTVSLLGYEE